MKYTHIHGRVVTHFSRSLVDGIDIKHCTSQTTRDVPEFVNGIGLFAGVANCRIESSVLSDKMTAIEHPLCLSRFCGEGRQAGWRALHANGTQ